LIGDIIVTNILASACLVLLVYFFDINEKEPPWTLVKVYIFSILLTFLFGKLKYFLFTRFEWQFPVLFENYIVAGFFEELLKLIVILIFVWHLKSFNEEIDGVIYFLIVAAGFAVLENVGYAFRFVLHPFIFGMKTGQMGIYKKALQDIVVLRAVSGHIFINVVSGVFLGFAKRMRKWWLLIPGFIVSVLLHGTWNQMGHTGYLGYFVLAFFIMDVILFIWLVRRSFYFKFIKRLKTRIECLIQQARRINLKQDVIILMEGILRKMDCLRRLEGDELKKQAKVILEALPSQVDTVYLEGKSGLVERLLKINGILSFDRKKTGLTFWFLLFLKFLIPGFFILTVLMYLT
jgi:RsiW-degrading membrane proteinase PrsW (M82 family)